MENIFKFWNYFSKIFYGISFVILLIFNYFDSNLIIQKIKLFLSYKFLDNIINELLLIIIILAFGQLGFLIQKIIICSIGFFISKLININIVKKFIIQNNINSFLSIEDNILYFFKIHKEDIYNFIIFRSYSMPENIDRNLAPFYERLMQYYNYNFKSELALFFDYHGGITQEQVSREKSYYQIEELYCLLVNFLLLFYTFYYYNIISLILLILFCVILILIFSPIISKRKIFYASAVVYGFFDNFSIGDSQEMPDREAY